MKLALVTNLKFTITKYYTINIKYCIKNSNQQ